jgi:hypothetical protein
MLMVETFNLSKRMLVRALLEHCIEQVADWQRVPYLCLQAQGLSGWSDTYGYCVEYGYWRLSYTAGGSYHYSIDCGTGILMSCGGERAIPDDDFNLLNISPDQFDANGVCGGLREDVLRAAGTDHSVSENRMSVDWRAKKAEELKLGPIYRRLK